MQSATAIALCCAAAVALAASAGAQDTRVKRKEAAPVVWSITDDGTATWSREARFRDCCAGERFPTRYLDAEWTLERSVIDPGDSRLAAAVNEAVIAHLVATYERTIPNSPEVPISPDVRSSVIDSRGGGEETCTATFVSDLAVSFYCQRWWDAMHPETDAESLNFIAAADGVRKVDFEELLAGPEAKERLLALFEREIRRIMAEDYPEGRNSHFGRDEIPLIAASLLRNAWLRPGGIESVDISCYGCAFDVDLSLVELESMLRPEIAAAIGRPEDLTSVALSLDPPKTLPGIPVTFRIAVTSESGEPVPIPRRAVLVVTPPGGAPFIASPDPDRLESLALFEDLSDQVLKRTASRRDPGVIVWEAWTLSTPTWFRDERIGAPGVYELRLFLDDRFAEEALRVCTAEELLGGAFPGALVSSPAELKIEEPQGADRAVWALMDGWPHPRAALVAEAKTIWTRHRSSSYARHVALLVDGSNAEEGAIAAESAEMYPPGAIRDGRNVRAGTLMMYAYSELQKADRARAANHLARAVEIFERLAESASDPKRREAAARSLTEIQACVAADACDFRSWITWGPGSR